MHQPSSVQELDWGSSLSFRYSALAIGNPDCHGGRFPILKRIVRDQSDFTSCILPGRHRLIKGLLRGGRGAYAVMSQGDKSTHKVGIARRSKVYCYSGYY